MCTVTDWRTCYNSECAYSNENHSSPCTFFEPLRVSVGMGMGENRDYFSGINGNWNIV